jgi:hypothetical protein
MTSPLGRATPPLVPSRQAFRSPPVGSTLRRGTGHPASRREQATDTPTEPIRSPSPRVGVRAEARSAEWVDFRKAPIRPDNGGRVKQIPGDYRREGCEAGAWSGRVGTDRDWSGLVTDGSSESTRSFGPAG